MSRTIASLRSTAAPRAGTPTRTPESNYEDAHVKSKSIPLTLAITYWAVSLFTIAAVALPLFGMPRPVCTNIGGASVIAIAISHYALRLSSIKIFQRIASVRYSRGTLNIAKFILYLSITLAIIITSVYIFYLSKGKSLNQSPSILALLPFALNIQAHGNSFLYKSPKIDNLKST